jgi:hypothetical protein
MTTFYITSVKEILFQGPFREWEEVGETVCLFTGAANTFFEGGGGVSGDVWALDNPFKEAQLKYEIFLTLPSAYVPRNETDIACYSTCYHFSFNVNKYMESSLSCTLDFFVRAFLCRHFSLFFMNEQWYVKGPCV